LHVGGRLVDRSDDGACGRVRLLTDVDGICSETHEDSSLSNNDKLKLFDDSRRAVRECEEVRDVADVKIVCVAGRTKCVAVLGKRERDFSAISQQMASRQQDRS
jgi:hypothetical protein